MWLNKKIISRGIITTIFILSINFAEGKSLDIHEYLKYSMGESIYPSKEQVYMLKSVLPDHCLQPSPTISNRAFWEKIALSESGKNWMSEALKALDKKPKIPISHEIYRKANETGQRGLYKPRYYRTMLRLEQFILAECMENKGRFLPKIQEYIHAIMSMKSWLHPNHDDRENSTLEGRKIKIDLSVRRFGSDLALALVLLEDKLPDALRDEVSAILHKRITTSYINTCRGQDTTNNWIKKTNNWNSVCTSGSVFTTLATSQNAEERLVVVGCALNSMKYYLSGFGEDGYCSEGVGYWGYGFGHYLYMAQLLFDYTNGQINLFEFDNKEKLNKVAHFPQLLHVQKGKYPAFSDSNINTKSNFGNFAKAMTAKHYGLNWNYSSSHESGAEQLVQWTALDDAGSVYVNYNLPDHSYFDDYGILISRGKQSAPFSIAIKVGHNAENHNHYDVGSYALFLDEDLVAGDIGKPVYLRGVPSWENKSRNSLGHPVPIINGQLQPRGRTYCGKIIKTEFSEKKDKVLMDIKSAYDIPELKRLNRIMENDRSGKGTVSIKDVFAASKPVVFGTTIMTYSEYKILDNHSILLISENQKVKAEIHANDCAIKITDEPVPVRLSSGKTAYRLFIEYTEPLQKGYISIRYSPVTN